MSFSKSLLPSPFRAPQKLPRSCGKGIMDELGANFVRIKPPQCFSLCPVCENIYVCNNFCQKATNLFQLQLGFVICLKADYPHQRPV